MTTLNPLAVQNAALLRELAKDGLDRVANVAELARRLERDESNLRKTIKTLDGERLLFASTLRLSGAGIEQLEAIDRAEAGDDGGDGRNLMLRHDQILPDPKNARRDWESADAKEDLEELAGSIRDRGVLQPPNVRPADADGRHELVGGERRWRAIGLLIASGDWPAHDPIPCRLFDADDIETRFAALDENIQRRNLNPIEEGLAFKDLYDRGVETAEIARRAKKTQRHVQMRMQLLELSEEQQRRMTLPEGEKDRLSVSDGRKLVQNLEAKKKLRDKLEAELTPRQRLILAEIRLAAGSEGIWVRVQVHGIAMTEDEDAVALDKAGLLKIPTTLDEEGRALTRFDWSAEASLSALFMDGLTPYAEARRAELGLPVPPEGQLSTAWLNGPFELTPELQAQIDADKAARAERQAEQTAEHARNAAARQARTERMAMMRSHAEAMLAKAAVAPLAPVIEDLPQIAGGLEHPLPWQATELAEVIDAEGDHVLCFGNFYAAAPDDRVALAMMTASAVNAAAGLETPPLRTSDEPDQDIEGNDPDAEPDENAHLDDDQDAD